MRIIDVLTSPWAIQPAKLLEIKAIYATHLRGDPIDIEMVEKRLGRPLVNERQPYENRDGVAVIPMQGVIAKRMNMFADISGGVSTELVARDIADALADQAVHSIVLHMDSPGGTADGTQALARTVMAARGSGKQIVAFADGVMASAAYWIGSAAQRVYMADGTTQVGSIGVVATHTDVSGMEEKAGVKTTEIYAGQYKRIASSYSPLSKEGKQSIQDQVDYLYGVFVADVAAQRGVPEETVLKNMADGRIFIGQQAIAAGLVDGVSTLDALVVDLNRSRTHGGAGVSVRSNDPEANWRDDATLRADFQGNIENYRAFIKADAAGRIKILGGHQTAKTPLGETHDSELLAESIIREWKSDAKVRSDFGDNLARYAAYRRAMESGRIRILQSGQGLTRAHPNFLHG